MNALDCMLSECPVLKNMHCSSCLSEHRSSSSTNTRKRSTMFSLYYNQKLILSLPCFSFLGGHHIPGSRIPSIHRSALWRPLVNLGQASAGTADRVYALRKSQNNYKLLGRAVWGRVVGCTPQITMWGVWKLIAQRFILHMLLTSVTDLSLYILNSKYG